MNIIEETGRNTGKGSRDVGKSYFQKSMGSREKIIGIDEETL